ncbi:MAG: cobalamin biosynthesis protein CobD [Burkholderiales bacterium]|nr:cobalamin biosynthesis protein CobD [Burkholderiales bacterium]OJX07454.1 MAG: cobalamin biosynthesis protein CobD [Burkholderiales bacterium 70-64]
MIAPVFPPDSGIVLALALALAWLADTRFGEPPDAWHPVAWLGRLLAAPGRWLRRLPPAPAFAGGAVLWLVLAAALVAAAAVLQAVLLAAPVLLAVPLLALAFAPTFAWRMLRDEVAAVEACLSGPAGGPRAAAPDRLVAARCRLARLVSRDVAAMDEPALRESAIETLAENLNDSVVAPLFWYALGGLPGAVLYRFANTTDAMWGYRGQWEWAGKWAARADDLLSWLPARITAVLLLPMPRAWRELRAQAASTPSPNGGWPMGAMALRLGVCLAKPGAYRLNEEAPAPRAEHTAQALRLGARAASIGVVLAALACLARPAWA